MELVPNYVKQSADVNSFKANLENYKMENMDTIDTGIFWEISYHVLNKIECVNYLISKSTHSLNSLANPQVAKRKGIVYLLIFIKHVKFHSIMIIIIYFVRYKYYYNNVFSFIYLCKLVTESF